MATSVQYKHSGQSGQSATIYVYEVAAHNRHVDVDAETVFGKALHGLTEICMSCLCGGKRRKSKALRPDTLRTQLQRWRPICSAKLGIQIWQPGQSPTYVVEREDEEKENSEGI